MFIIDNFPEQIIVKAITRTAFEVKNRQSTTKGPFKKYVTL